MTMAASIVMEAKVVEGGGRSGNHKRKMKVVVEAGVEEYVGAYRFLGGHIRHRI